MLPEIIARLEEICNDHMPQWHQLNRRETELLLAEVWHAAQLPEMKGLSFPRNPTSEEVAQFAQLFYMEVYGLQAQRSLVEALGHLIASIVERHVEVNGRFVLDDHFGPRMFLNKILITAGVSLPQRIYFYSPCVCLPEYIDIFEFPRFATYFDHIYYGSDDAVLFDDQLTWFLWFSHHGPVWYAPRSVEG